ncbi:50S ribosomal protein L19 [Candidatus Curtissbacteria bacterium]|nr:50S ribosomal protein L19 [Candidatus Curtissbacteria bacterium]
MEATSQTPFKVGDIIKVTTRDPKAGKVHATPFEGMVISLRGESPNKTFTVRKISSGKIAIERIFPLFSPSIEKITVVKVGRVRRAKLYHLRKKNS